MKVNVMVNLNLPQTIYNIKIKLNVLFKNKINQLAKHNWALGLLVGNELEEGSAGFCFVLFSFCFVSFANCSLHTYVCGPCNWLLLFVCFLFFPLSVLLPPYCVIATSFYCSTPSPYASVDSTDTSHRLRGQGAGKQ